MKLNREQRRTAGRTGRRSPWRRVEYALDREPWRKCEIALVKALKRCFQGGKHARIYRGDRRLAELGKIAPISVWRAKNYLEQRHILHVTHTRGGYTRNPKGELVRAATGYEPHPDLYTPVAKPVTAPAAELAEPPAGTLEDFIARRQAERAQGPP